MDEFKVLINGRIVVFNNYDDIPMEFDNLISFKPHVIPSPHTEEEHQINSVWNGKLQLLMERELK
jgi:hypothetical protein